MPEDLRTEEDIENAKQQIDELKEQQNKKRTEVTVSSWHINKDENFAMWKIYAKGAYGLALQTRYEKLKRCFDATDKPIYIGKVIYYDESCDPLLLVIMTLFHYCENGSCINMKMKCVVVMHYHIIEMKNLRGRNRIFIMAFLFLLILIP